MPEQPQPTDSAAMKRRGLFRRHKILISPLALVAVIIVAASCSSNEDGRRRREVVSLPL